MKFKKFALIFLIPTFLGVLLLQSCNEQPTELGMILHKDTVVVEGISTPEFELFSDYSIYKFYSSYRELSVLLGSYEDYKATSLFQIGFEQRPDTLDYLSESDIISAKLYLFFNNYRFGDTVNSTLSFDVQRLERFWSPKIFNDTERSEVFTTWDSLFVSPANYLGTKVGNYIGTVDIYDSASAIINIDISKEYVLDLFKVEKFDTNNDGIIDSTINVIDWGFALIPNENSRVINQLNFFGVGTDLSTTTDLRTPYIEVIFNSKEGNIDTLKMYTVTASQFSKSPEIPDDRFAIQAGDFFRTSIGFNIEDLPRLSGIIKADVELFVDMENSRFGTKGIDTVISLSYMIDTMGLDIYNTLPYLGYYNDSTKSYYFPSVGSSVELWLRSDFYSSLILSTNLVDNSLDANKNENLQFDRVVFYGPKATDPKKRPKMTIIYSHVPEDN